MAAIPENLRSVAQRELPPNVIAQLERDESGSRLPNAVWAGLNKRQRMLVAEVRGAIDSFGASRDSGSLPTGERTEPFIGKDPIQSDTNTASAEPLRGDELVRDILHTNPPPALDVTQFKGVQGQALRNALRSAQGPGRVIDYARMRQEAYTYIFNRSGRLLDYYTGQQKTAKSNPSPSDYNWEHIFAQSWNGLRDTMWRAHAFNGVPTHDRENAMRGHLPFGEVTRVTEKSGLVSIGTDALGHEVAQLDPAVRGDIALRALWMYTEAPEYLPEGNQFMLPILVKWLVDDPPTLGDLEVVQRAEAVEEETLYYAHCPRDLVLRAFVDVLERYDGPDREITRLATEARQLANQAQIQAP